MAISFVGAETIDDQLFLAILNAQEFGPRYIVTIRGQALWAAVKHNMYAKTFAEAGQQFAASRHRGQCLQALSDYWETDWETAPTIQNQEN